VEGPCEQLARHLTSGRWPPAPAPAAPQRVAAGPSTVLCLAGPGAANPSFKPSKPASQYLVDEGITAKFCCDRCGCDIASEGQMLWEGFMGANQPAMLFRSAINLAPCSAKREEVRGEMGVCSQRMSGGCSGGACG